MRHEYEKARRHAENTLAEVNRHLDKGNIRNPRHHQMLTDMAEKATRTLNNLDTMDDARPYSNTNIGYNADMRQRRYAHDNTNNTINAVMDAIDKILPRIANNRYDDMDDDVDEVVDRRGRGWRPRRTRRGVGRFTQVRTHVRRMPRSEMDDRYDDMDDMYDDRYDDMNNRYDNDARYDNRYDDTRSRYDHEKRMDDAVARVAADAAATTARRMADDARYTNDTYPGTPVMPRNTHNEARYNPKNDVRNDADDTTSDRPTPGMRR